MKYTLYQVDAFTDKLFGGNPAAVIPLQEWIADDLMQQLALENNLSETVFFVHAETGADYDYHIRWFTPASEINLCGHATLASAWVLFNKLGFDQPVIRFQSLSGLLTVSRKEELITLDFPAWTPEPLKDFPAELAVALGFIPIKAVFKHRDFLVELESEEAVLKCQPDFVRLKRMEQKVIITAAGSNGTDFVSRFFAPVIGIDEDPVTGSAHSQLIPYWAGKLGKTNLRAKQLSRRGGELWCSLQGERVTMAGKCVYFMKGEIELNG
ncbi:PhzF family phenazine biosynthesis protein [Paraflavitalea pollutisoli]|uniref:PhzF family phenazine biosynthesis protein n=1 Tax=Paraflavitalea pollutisoli TaxID=3034143 RepID=UPI0023EAB079|nr:PhzF family phenazine biosynthesis protein [Paraflavitalea sp. H1-2-19X]